MIVDTVHGNPIIRMTTMTSAGETVQAAVHNDRLEYGYVRSNMSDREIIKRDIPAKRVFEDFVGYYGSDAYDKLKEIGFKLE